MDQSLLRQWRLLKALSVRRLGNPLKEMAQELEVNVRTIRRDLELFRRLGFPIREETGEFNRKRWRIAAEWNEPHKCFTFDEAIALFLARRSFEPLAGTPFWEAANRAFDKIRAALTDDVVAYLDRMADTFYQTHVGVSDYAGRRDLIETLWVGMEDRRAVKITYSSLHEPQPHSYAVHPYGMALHNGSLYLVGFSPKHDEVRRWKVDRVAATELTGERFCRPADFDLRQHFAGAFAVWHDGQAPLTVRVRFSPTAGRYVQEKRWHDTQQLHLQPDGSLIAEFQLSSTVELKSWILSFGEDAEILSPQDLREKVKKELENLLARYKTEPSARFPTTEETRSSNPRNKSRRPELSTETQIQRRRHDNK